LIQLRRESPRQVGHAQASGHSLDQPAIEEVQVDLSLFVCEPLFQIERSDLNPDVHLLADFSNQGRLQGFPLFNLSAWKLPQTTEMSIVETPSEKDSVPWRIIVTTTIIGER
jgi:hypothetical protein